MGLTEQLRIEHKEFRRRFVEWDLIADLEGGIGTFAALRLKEEAIWVLKDVCCTLNERRNCLPDTETAQPRSEGQIATVLRRPRSIA